MKKKGSALAIVLLFIHLYSFGAELSLVNQKKDWISFFDKVISIYNVDTFMESGTYLGETTAKAALCFDYVHTIELHPPFYRDAVKLFKHSSNVEVHFGDSAKLFPELLPKLANDGRKFLFWLDGHFMSCMDDEESEKTLEGSEYTPIVRELEAIRASKLKDSIILIDDARLFGTRLHGQRLERVGKSYYPLLVDIFEILKQCEYKAVVIGDIIVAVENTSEVLFSPVIEACTMSRLYDGSNYAVEDILEAERIIAEAQGEELEALGELYVDFAMPWRGWYNKSSFYNLWYGLILQFKGENEKACKQFEEVVNLGYDHWRVFWYMAQSLYGVGDLEGAEYALKKVNKACPSFEIAHELLAEILEHKKNAYKQQRRYVIGSWPGGLGVCLHSVLHQLYRCESEGFTPVVHWGGKSLYHAAGGFNGAKNVWEYYFEPVSDAHFAPGDPVHVFYPRQYGFCSYNNINLKNREQAYELIKKYIRVKPQVQKKIDAFYRSFMQNKSTIGMHIRGTDKVKERPRVATKRIIDQALKYADDNTQFLIATDEQKVIDETKQLLEGRTVIYYDCYRSQDGKPLHVRSRRPSFAQVGEDVLVEMILLSKCDMLVHTRSNVSAVPLYFNPTMHDVLVT